MQNINRNQNILPMNNNMYSGIVHPASMNNVDLRKHQFMNNQPMYQTRPPPPNFYRRPPSNSRGMDARNTYYWMKIFGYIFIGFIVLIILYYIYNLLSGGISGIIGGLFNFTGLGQATGAIGGLFG